MISYPNKRVENQKLKYVGKIFKSKRFGYFAIIDYNGCENVTIKFVDTGYVATNITIGNILKGEVKDLLFKGVCGIGYIGGTTYGTTTKIGKVKLYPVWVTMLNRCYSKKRKTLQPAYTDCLCSEEWHNFQIFSEWCRCNLPRDEGIDYQLDKDILIKGNKIYSPATCCFVPARVNKLLEKSTSARGNLPLGVRSVGSKYAAYASENRQQIHLGMFNTQEDAFEAYRKEKLRIIKSVVSEYKDVLLPHVKEALLNYDISIDD